MTDRSSSGLPPWAREALLIIGGFGLLGYEAAHRPADLLIVAAGLACLGLVPLSFVERLLSRNGHVDERPPPIPREDP